MLALASLLPALAPVAPLRNCAPAHASSRAAASSISMINLFGNTEESTKRRNALSLRSAPPGSRVVSFRKPNQATTGLMLGLKFRQSFGNAIYIDKVIPGTEADRLKKSGQLKEGDEVVMVSATFGDELWSARGIGKQRLEKSIAVRQGMNIKLVLEGSSSDDKKRKEMAAKAANAEKAKITRLQAKLEGEVQASKGQEKKFFGLF